MGRKVSVSLALLFGVWGFFVWMVSAPAQSVVSIAPKLDTKMSGTGGRKLSAVACDAPAASLCTGFVRSDNQSRVSYLISFVDVGSTAANLHIACVTSNTTSHPPGTNACYFGYNIPVITATSASGVSTLVVSSYDVVASGGGPPGSLNLAVTAVANSPGAYVACQFTCGAGAVHAATVTVDVQGSTP